MGTTASGLKRVRCAYLQGRMHSVCAHAGLSVWLGSVHAAAYRRTWVGGRYILLPMPRHSGHSPYQPAHAAPGCMQRLPMQQHAWLTSGPQRSALRNPAGCPPTFQLTGMSTLRTFRAMVTTSRQMVLRTDSSSVYSSGMLVTGACAAVDDTPGCIGAALAADALGAPTPKSCKCEARQRSGRRPFLQRRSVRRASTGFVVCQARCHTQVLVRAGSGSFLSNACGQSTHAPLARQKAAVKAT